MKLKKNEIVKCATYVYETTCENSCEGSYYIPIADVEDYIGKEIEEKDFYKICDTIREKFSEAVIDVNEDEDEDAWDEGEFNMNVDEDYLIDEEDGDEDEDL